MCLNPCFGGIYSLIEVTIEKLPDLAVVLILVLVEFTL